MTIYLNFLVFASSKYLFILDSYSPVFVFVARGLETVIKFPSLPPFVTGMYFLFILPTGIGLLLVALMNKVSSGGKFLNEKDLPSPDPPVISIFSL